MAIQVAGEGLEELRRRDRVVIGGSEGSLRPLLSVLSDLPANLPAAVFIVQHRLPDAKDAIPVIARHCGLPVALAKDREWVREGVVYVAPPDFHLLFAGPQMRVLRGPRENLARPSIDVLFRSAAVEFGSRSIGVVLSGAMDDGASGLSAIIRCGGCAIVQEPGEAVNDELPRAALEAAKREGTPVAQIATAVTRLCNEPASPAAAVPRDLAFEARAAALAMTDPRELNSMGEPSHFTCPECDGPLVRIRGEQNEQYRCDVGHAFSLASLSAAQSMSLERALWVAYRTLLERGRLLDGLASGAEARGAPASAASYRKRMRELKEHSDAVLSALSSIDPGTDISDTDEPSAPSIVE